MFRRILPRGLAPLFLSGLLAACGGGGDTPSPPPANPAATISLAAAGGSVTAGAATSVVVTLSRSGGFTGPITIAATGAPAGVTVAGGTIDAAATTLTVNISTTAAAAAGTTSLSIAGTGTGVTIAPATFALTVNAAPAATLSLTPAAITVSAGGSTTVTANIVRSGGFAGAVTIAATGAPGSVTVTGGAIAAGATSQVVTITAGAGATAGLTNVGITGTATGISIAPATLSLTVYSLPTGQIGEYIGGEAAGDQAAAVALSADGTRVVVGALLNDGTASSAGHARVFQRNGSTWTQMGADLDGEAADDRFGGAVDINNAGTRIIVGSYLNDGGGNASGHARVFDWNGSQWTQVGGDIDGGAVRGSGWSVAMSASGDRVVIGGPGVGTETGEVSVYEYVGSAWTLMGTRLTGSFEFGHAVAMSDDGTRIATSLPSGSTNGPGTVVVYNWNGSAWVQGASIAGEAADDNAGYALSLSADGNMLAIGAPYNIGGGADGGGVRGGQVRVYRFSNGSWTQVGADLDGSVGSGLGAAVSLSANGSRLFAGAAGIVRLYVLNGTSWVLDAALPYVSDRRFGSSLSLSADGAVGAVGAEYGDTAAGNAAGIVRIYALPAP